MQKKRLGEVQQLAPMQTLAADVQGHAHPEWDMAAAPGHL
jgi:hypothetical protein|tara:strand:- start:224 stop:343 length:120 start_codon:yes stop_codon:yes gene_type:complete